MGKYQTEFSIGDEVLYKKKYYGVIKGIHLLEVLNSIKAKYQVCFKKGPIGDTEWTFAEDLNFIFTEDTEVVVKFNHISGSQIEVRGRIMCIDTMDKECFDLQIGTDGQYITPCYKKDIVRYITGE